MQRDLLKVVLIAILSIALVRPAKAETFNSLGDQIIAGIVVVSAAVVVGIVLIVLHEKHKTRAITGCVTSGAGGMSVTDDKEKRVYALSGDPVGVKPGDRMTLEGRRRGKIFEARSVIKDLGVCQP
jgi:hypothetical protein